jgi:putative transposase
MCFAAALEKVISMTDWPHSPAHRLSEAGSYMVTCGTYLKQHHFREARRLRFLHDSLLGLAATYGWNLQAWAVFSNHYHFVAISPPHAENLVLFLKKLHADTALEANQWDGTPGRQVWFQYWDKHLTFERSYFARLNYVHRNAVHHGLVAEPSLYPWCSAGWFERRAPAAFYKTVMGFKSDRVNVPDDFAVDWRPDAE